MKKKILKFFKYSSLLFLGLIFILSFFSNSNENREGETHLQNTEEVINLINKNHNNKDYLLDKNNEDQEEDFTNNTTEDDILKTKLYKVHNVVDGDTIKIYINNNLESIRMIGLDTPETVDPRKEVQCFGLEASNKAKEILGSKNVILEKDESQGERDKYGRLLLYVYLEDGTLFNKWMIENGYGHEYTYNIPYKYQTEFQNAEKYARENNLGLWSDDACAEINSVNNLNNTSESNIVNQDTETNESAQVISGSQVKKSSTGICHEKGTTYYERTKNFTSYNSIEECLNSGGRLPKN